MKPRSVLTIGVLATLALGAIYFAREQTIQPHPREVHLRNIRQLTSGGENAEAYFSLDGKQIIFQSTREPYKCDQIFTMNQNGSNVRLVSTGKGRTSCGYFTPDGKRIIYASTHLGSPDCPPPADRSLRRSAGYSPRPARHPPGRQDRSRPAGARRVHLPRFSGSYSRGAAL